MNLTCSEVNPEGTVHGKQPMYLAKSGKSIMSEVETKGWHEVAKDE